MLRCDQCGFENRDTDKFCASCGNPLTKPDVETLDSPSETAAPVQRPSFMPPPVTPSFTSSTPPPASRSVAPSPPPLPTTAPIEKTDFDFSRPTYDPVGEPDTDWTMSSLGPPPPRKRRLWLWIIIGIIILCVLVCGGLGIWFGFTDSGQEFWDNIEATATAQAGD